MKGGEHMPKRKKVKDLDPKSRAKKVKGGNDRDNLNNSMGNVFHRDAPRVVKFGTLGRVRVDGGRVRIKP
jgi:hypothetical protein